MSNITNNRKRKSESLSKIELLEANSIPAARSGHRIVLYDNNLYSLGGYNDEFINRPNDDFTNYPILKELNKCNLMTREWKKLRTKGEMPSELASHSVCLCGDQLVVFAGTGIPFGEKLSNKLHLLNLSTLEWKHVSCTGDIPSPHYGSSFTRHNNLVYVFGGTSGWEFNNLMYCLNLSTMVWKLIQPANHNLRKIPYPRYRHEMIYHEEHLFLFGGGKATISYDFVKIQVFDIEKRTWTHHETLEDITHGFPESRRCHACLKYRNTVVMFGGYNGENALSDVWRLCLSSLQWSRSDTIMPVPLYFHSAAVTDEGNVVIYGGVQESGERSSQIFTFWLKVPTLKTLCWNNIYNSSDIKIESENDECNLIDIGIPTDLLKQIKY